MDHFKSINDRFGHVSGDEALKQISVAVQLAMRPTDLVGRIGGEEFAILLPATTSSQASLVAERIRQRVSAIEFPDGGQRLLSVSTGGVHFQRESSFERLFRIADRCLYLAKAHGRNRVNMIEHIGVA